MRGRAPKRPLPSFTAALVPQRVNAEVTAPRTQHRCVCLRPVSTPIEQFNMSKLTLLTA